MLTYNLYKEITELHQGAQHTSYRQRWLTARTKIPELQQGFSQNTPSNLSPIKTHHRISSTWSKFSILFYSLRPVSLLRSKKSLIRSQVEHQTPLQHLCWCRGSLSRRKHSFKSGRNQCLDWWSSILRSDYGAVNMKQAMTWQGCQTQNMIRMAASTLK